MTGKIEITNPPGKRTVITRSKSFPLAGPTNTLNPTLRSPIGMHTKKSGVIDITITITGARHPAELWSINPREKILLWYLRSS
jgi:hypothetical protein